MVTIKLFCVGDLKENFYKSASAEYIKRISPQAKIEVIELPQAPIQKNPSVSEISAALEREGAMILNALSRQFKVIALCVEGNRYTSESFADKLESWAVSSGSRIAFIIGGSHGLSPSVKAAAAECLSLSDMTFPHHLARIVLLEQIYRGFSIKNKLKYNK